MVVKSIEVPQVQQFGRVVVITGTGRGVDPKTARLLAHLAACVAVAAIQEEDSLARPSLPPGDGKALAIRSEMVETEGEPAMFRPDDAPVAPNDLAAFCTSGGLLRRAAQHRITIFAGKLRHEFLRMRELLGEMLQLDGGVMISMETVKDSSAVRL